VGEAITRSLPGTLVRLRSLAKSARLYLAVQEQTGIGNALPSATIFFPVFGWIYHLRNRMWQDLPHSLQTPVIIPDDVYLNSAFTIGCRFPLSFSAKTLKKNPNWPNS